LDSWWAIIWGERYFVQPNLGEAQRDQGVGQNFFKRFSSLRAFWGDNCFRTGQLVGIQGPQIFSKRATFLGLETCLVHKGFLGQVFWGHPCGFGKISQPNFGLGSQNSRVWEKRGVQPGETIIWGKWRFTGLKGLGYTSWSARIFIWDRAIKGV